MLDIEQAIREVGTVYQALTGRPIEGGRSDLPPAIDDTARAHIEDRYRRFKTIMDAPPLDASTAPVWAPAIEVTEREAEVRYEIDLPAVGRDQVGVSVLGGFLVVRGVRSARSAHGTHGTNGTNGAAEPAEAGSGRAPGAAVRYSERPSGPFQRVIALPPRARRDGLQAVLRDGVLAVTVPTDGPSGAPVAVEIR